MYDGSAWLGITPFRLTGLRARGLLPLPGLSSFCELNVRTYVRAPDGKPGVWFLGIDASSRLVAELVAPLRASSRTPTRACRSSVTTAGSRSSARAWGIRGRVFSGRYRARRRCVRRRSRARSSRSSTERYCLYTTDAGGALLRGENHHGPWALQRAEAELELTDDRAARAEREPLHSSRRTRCSADLAVRAAAGSGRRATRPRYPHARQRRARRLGGAAEHNISPSEVRSTSAQYASRMSAATDRAVLRGRRDGPDRAEARHGPRHRQPRSALGGRPLRHRPDRRAAHVLRRRRGRAAGRHAPPVRARQGRASRRARRGRDPRDRELRRSSGARSSG